MRSTERVKRGSSNLVSNCLEKTYNFAIIAYAFLIRRKTNSFFGLGRIQNIHL
jgi:hypothetical protein